MKLLNRFNVHLNVLNNNPFYLILICSTVFVSIIYGSIWQGSYNNDPHHWGLMLSNAKDYFEGKVPYRDIFIQYGFLTTAIHSLGYGLFGSNLISIISITAIAYGLGLLIVFRITYEITESAKISIYVLITCFLIHPYAIYPWSNYIAFPFLTYGIFLLIKKNKTWLSNCLSGLFFGLAFLSREGLAPAIIVIIISSNLMDFLAVGRNKRNAVISTSLHMLGVALPVGAFCLYVNYNDLWNYWYKLSWLLPKIYISEVFPNAIGLRGIYNLLSHIFHRTIILDYRWIFIGIVILLNLFLVISAIKSQNKTEKKLAEVKVAIASLVLLTSTMHIPEIFRLSTGSIVGVITVYSFLERFKIANYLFIVSLAFLGFTLGAANSGNYFWPNKHIIRSSIVVDSPSVFKGQRWQSDAIEYYNQIESDLNRLRSVSSCNIHYHYNYTMDAFLQVLSPYKQYQIAPFGLGDSMSNLRSDLDFTNKITIANDIIIFKMVADSDFNSYKIQNGFILYNSYLVPSQFFMPIGNRLLLLIPQSCKSS